LKALKKNVWKYVFTNEDMVLESVLYKYNSFEERTVICCSVQSGCPVGCIFCGTGNNFIKNCTAEQILFQIEKVLYDNNLENINTSCEKFQIMFMSMGEPMLNWIELEKAIKTLNYIYPNSQLLISTIGVKDDGVFNKITKLSNSI
jgi:23S rRNA (adenine2503-C2)-methyltransferase